MKAICKKEHTRQGFEINLGQEVEFVECPIGQIPEGVNQTHMVDHDGNGWQLSYSEKQFNKYYV